MASIGNQGTPPVPIELDRRLMAAALRLGRRSLGRTWPNPAVGALVVRMEGGQPIIVGRGATAASGRPHAETIALTEAGEAARGATVYVTLEPCSHEGQAPPCVNALISAGVSRVVSAMADPDPRVKGRGYEALVKAGIALTTDVLADEAARAHAGHISRVTRGRPHVLLKLAVSADGMIGRREGERMNITGRAAFAAVQAMRAEYDVVIIGIGTALVDNPRLTVRLPGMEGRSPARAVLDAQARLPLDSHLVTTARQQPLILVVGPEAPPDRKMALEEAGALIMEVGDGPGGVNLEQTFQRLGGEGLTRVLVEGGANVASSLVSADLLDEVVLFRASVVVGPDGVRALAGHALSAIERSPRYRQIDFAMVGDDQMRRYIRVT